MILVLIPLSFSNWPATCNVSLSFLVEAIDCLVVLPVSIRLLSFSNSAFLFAESLVRSSISFSISLIVLLTVLIWKLNWLIFELISITLPLSSVNFVSLFSSSIIATSNSLNPPSSSPIWVLPSSIFTALNSSDRSCVQVGHTWLSWKNLCSLWQFLIFCDTFVLNE